MEPLRLRQIHLDFHTSSWIPDVGADWDAQAFVETLQRAHVNSINLFARCHHGYVYYLPTRIMTPHPALRVNLLGEQIEACHRAGIKAPIYVTVGWDELTASRHPEWQEVTPAGVRGGNSPLEARWKKLCLNTPYLDYVWDHTVEIIDLFGKEVDGFWFDITFQNECVCPACLAGMQRQGLNPEKSEDRQKYAQQVVEAYRRRFGAGVRARKPDCLIFHNAGHIGYGVRTTVDTYTHLELESLPSGGWGYNHFPITIRYARTLNKPTLGMTGKFHTSWGDFSSFKNLPALEFECFQMLANGAAVCVGDQLHPRGRLDKPVYDLIGKVYASIEAKEPWCLGAVPQAEIAVFNVEAVGQDDARADSSSSGVLRMLMEAHYQFDFVDEQTDWSAYRLVVFPDKVPFNADLAAKVRAYLAQGGKVIASYHSGLTPGCTRPQDQDFALPEFGVAYIGEAPHVPDYVRPRPALGADLEDTDYVIYDQGLEVRPLPGTIALADAVAPYFNRTWAHFCSHRQTPPNPHKPTGYPPVTLNAAGNVIYFAHPLFYGYRQKAELWYKRLFLGAVKRFVPDPLVVCQAPSTAQATILFQPKEQRTVVHLLHYIPERRGTEFDVLEDVIPLYNVPLAFKTAKRPSRVYLAPTNKDVAFTYEGGYVRLTVPDVMGHQMVVAE
jgi:hypothetical protein